MSPMTPPLHFDPGLGFVTWFNHLPSKRPDGHGLALRAVYSQETLASYWKGHRERTKEAADTQQIAMHMRGDTSDPQAPAELPDDHGCKSDAGEPTASQNREQTGK